MAEKKFSELTAKGTTIADTDLVAISESAGGGTYTSKSVTGANIKALVTDANLSTTDITTNDVSTSKHGFAPKAPNDGTKFLDGTGAYDTVKDSDLSLSDITTNNVSTTAHGFTPKAPNDTTKFLRGDGTWAAPAAGGLTKFTEAESTSAPNATVYVDSLTAAASTTNADFAIVPKGNGAIIAAIPDNTATGGNKRGTGAVDLQISRSANDRVASGNYSTIMGGAENRASGSYAISGGYGAFATGYMSTAFQQASASGILAFAHGSRTIASGFGAVSFGSYSYADTIASGDNSFALGAANQSTAFGSTAIGGYGNVASGVGSYAFGYGASTFGIEIRQSRGRYNTVTGDCQKSEFYLSVRTTNQVILSNQSAYRFKGTIIGKQSGSTNAAAWDVDGLIVRGANAAATTLLISNVTVVQNTPAWGTPTLAADTTNGGLRVQVTGAAATNIQWTAVIETTEVIYA